MATIRSATPTKSSERLLNRRSTRRSTSSSSGSQKKTHLPPKATTTTMSTIKRANSSRLSMKQSPIPPIKSSPRVNSLTHVPIHSAHEKLVDKMASTKICALPPIRRASKNSDINLKISSIPTVQINSEDETNVKQIELPPNQQIELPPNQQIEHPQSYQIERSLSNQTEQPQNENVISNNINDKLSAQLLSKESSQPDIQFTLESFDILRTIGTGKVFHII